MTNKAVGIMSGAGIAIMGVAAFVSLTAGHVGPAYLYPKPSITPGLADTLSVADLTKRYNGLTYSQSHRNVTEATKNVVRQEYATTTEVTKTGEVDHFYPECGGGNNGLKNLWLQPLHNWWNDRDFGFKAKDKLETWVCNEIKAGRLDPKVAFDSITRDWVAYYLRQFPSETFGGATGDPVE